MFQLKMKSETISLQGLKINTVNMKENAQVIMQNHPSGISANSTLVEEIRTF